MPELRRSLESLAIDTTGAGLDSLRSASPSAAQMSGARANLLGRVAAHGDWLALALAVCLWAGIFGGLALTRHAAGGTHAEDLGFTDQVIWNFLRAQWFRTSIYQGAADWNTEFDIAHIARPDSLLAFHVEPMLLLFVPAYALGGDARFLLGLQALCLALGAVPAYRLGVRWGGTRWTGAAIAAAYLLSPLGQWAVLSDFHTTSLAAPLLLFAFERWAAGHSRAFVQAALLAVTAREDVALVVAGLGLVAIAGGWRRTGLLLAGCGTWACVASFLIMRAYSGGSMPLAGRYTGMQADPASVLESLGRPIVVEYAMTLWLGGGWLAWLSPLVLIPALPILALNLLSSSPWMAAGKAHYSVLVLPFLIAGAAGGLGRVARWQRTLEARRAPGARRLSALAAGCLVLTSAVSYVWAGTGPQAANYAPPTLTEHVQVAASIARTIPSEAGVSASSSLVPRLSQRARVYVFPATEDADYVFVDVTAGAGITAGDLYQRVHMLLAEGEWDVREARDGLLLLSRVANRAAPSAADLPAEFYSFARADGHLASYDPRAPRPVASPRIFLDGVLELVTAEFVPSPSARLDVEGPHGELHTIWRANGPVPYWVRPAFRFDLRDGQQIDGADAPSLWWYPPERWLPGELVRITVPSVPLHRVIAWRVDVRHPEDQRFGSAGHVAPTGTSLGESIRLGELTLRADAEPWRLRLLDPAGGLLWEESADQTLGFRTADGSRWRATRLLGATILEPGAVRMVADTDDPLGRTLTLEARSLGPRALRLTVTPGAAADVRSVGGAILAAPDERFLGFGERFTGVNRRGHIVEVWAEDRVLAGHGPSTYAPLPLLLSSQGHGMLLERFERSRFDLAATQHDRWTWEQDAASASILVTYGPSLGELVQRNAEIMGLPPLPPLWAFGVWKTVTGGQAHALDEIRRLRALQIPVSAVYAYDAIDTAANLGWPHVNFGGRWGGVYADHAAFTAVLHRLGLKALAYFKADFHLDRPGYDEPARLGFLVKRADGHPYVDPRFPVSWLDFTNPRAVAWWGRLWQRALGELGYDGGMIDVGEILPPDAYLADGTRGLETHNRYPLLYAQHAWQHASRLRPDGDFVLFTRSGAVGAQRFQSLQWPGDPQMRWEAPSGLRSLVPAALSFGLSGFPFWHPEVAGYQQVGLTFAEERELWLRWLQLATWSSTLRDNYGDHPLTPVDFWLDEETITAYRDAARIHNSLVPYLYTYAAEASRTGLPLMRFVPLEVPQDPRAWQEEQSYFLGPLLLVAPVVEPSHTHRRVYLPLGEWVDFWTDELYGGGDEVTVSASLAGGRAPVFVRAGAILPLATEFDTLVPSDTPDVRTWAGDLAVRLVRGGAGPAEFTLFDGTKLEWDGASTLRLTANARPRTVVVRFPDGIEVAGRVEGPSGDIRVP
jgi:alpha-glucosidase (family GH31 glycosyl hydrolase)/uncharacterized membrane protein